MNIKYKKEQGLALLASLLVLVVITLLGLTVAKKGIVLEKVAKATVRYEEIANVAEIAMRQAVTKLEGIDRSIPGGDMSKGPMSKISMSSSDKLTMVWSPKKLRGMFSKSKVNGSTARTQFGDFNDSGWDAAILNTADASDENDSSYGKIKTYTFIELIVEPQDEDEASEAVYLITVKASAQSPGMAADQFIEKIVIQSVYTRHFNTKATKFGTAATPI